MGTSRPLGSKLPMVAKGKEETAMHSVAPMATRVKVEIHMGSKAPTVARGKVVVAAVVVAAVAMEDGVMVKISVFTSLKS